MIGQFQSQGLGSLKTVLLRTVQPTMEEFSADWEKFHKVLCSFCYSLPLYYYKGQTKAGMDFAYRQFL
jgi:hypothetical protein